MEQKKKQAIIGSIAVAAVVLIGVIVILVKKFTPSKEIMDLKEYYNIAENEVVLLLEDRMYEKKGIILDDVIYVDYETVEEYMNHRFYWDSNENILTYTTPSEVIRTELGSKSYFINKSETTRPYTIVKSFGDKVYIALEYVKEFSNVEYEVYEEPKRMMIRCNWGEEFLYANTTSNTVIRYEASIKSPILKQIASGEKLAIVTEDEATTKGFTKVMSSDGVIGYVKNKNLSETYYEKLVNNYQEPVYRSISKSFKINMVWHQVTNQKSNDTLLQRLETTKGVNVISPTWFAIQNNEGEISSLANDTYVKRAHNQGIEVWALVADFADNATVDMKEVLSYTSKRDKLINALIAEAIKYNLDGLNIDFEKISANSARDYIQFIRELSVKCRSNGIVLSVDNYVPAAYNAFYDREEQGKVVDYVITMAYDEFYAGSEEAGSTASIQYVSDAVKNTVKQVPAEKVIIALPFYTRLWKEKEGTLSSEAYGMAQGEKVLADQGVTPEWNEQIGQYYGQFEKDGTNYRIWLENESSYELKLQAAFSENIAGVAAWKLGLEKESIWNLIAKYVN